MEKILLVAQEGLNKGGIQTVIMNIVKNLCNKYRFDIILFTNEIRFYDKEFESYGGKIFRINSIKWMNKRFEKLFRSTIGYFMIKKIIKQNGPYKAIHCHNSIESPTALAAAKACNISVRVNQVHVVFDDSKSNYLSRKYHDILKSQMMRYATVSVGCSELACKSFFSSNYKIIVNPYDDSLFLPSNIEVDSDSPHLIQVGNISDLKNQCFTIRVFNELLCAYPEAHLTLVGNDYDGHILKVRRLIKDYNIENHVSIYPAESDIPKLMQYASYLLMPSITESFGIVLVEAQAMGLTCFASDVIPKEADAGGCVFLSINEKPKLWADRIVDNFQKTNGRHKRYNLSSYKGLRIANMIDQLYCGQ